MGVSHDCNTLGPPDHLGISPIAKGKPLPKRDRAWECAGGEEYYSGPQPGLNIILPFAAPGAQHDSPGKVIIKYFLTFFTMESRYNFHD